MAVVPDGSELNQERIDEIIKVGEVAELAGIEPGYLINSKYHIDSPSDVLNDLIINFSKVVAILNRPMNLRRNVQLLPYLR